MPKRMQTWTAVCVLTVATSLAQPPAGADQKLASDFWAWRARTAQYTGDDVNRMERPRGATRDWSAAGVENQRRDLSAFEARWKSQDDPKAPIAQQVDHRLLGSALARVHWELDILKRWQRDPNFYIEQAVTPVGEALTVPGPMTAQRARKFLRASTASPRF